jgi:5-methylcytosine-specific restriction endonuclease McrA
MPTVQRKPPSQNVKKTDPFYLSVPWRNLTLLVRNEEPLCAYCKLKGRITASELTDHFKPRRLFPELQLVRSNMKGCCHECHNLKRAWEKGIFTRDQFELEILNFIQSLKTN